MEQPGIFYFPIGLPNNLPYFLVSLPRDQVTATLFVGMVIAFMSRQFSGAALDKMVALLTCIVGVTPYRH